MAEARNDSDAPDTPPLRVLLVDNERAHARAMEESLVRVGYECAVAFSGPEGAARLKEGQFDLVVTDLVMPQLDGMQILLKARATQDPVEVIVVTGHGTVPKAVEAMQKGAFNFIEKPITPDGLRATVAKAADSVRLKRENVELTRRLDERFGFEGIIAASPAMKQVIDQLKRIAPTEAGVLIRGENGTGKELVAQAIHHNSPRKNKPFVGLNCGAVAEHLVESELFGHVKGAFTDAISERIGKFEYANGGTLLLDEVGDMPIATQIKLLRVLEEREITRVGDNKPIKVNVRVLAATNRDLEEQIEEGEFRIDLYHRLKVVTVDLPPLRARQEDIVPLADTFRRLFAKRHHKQVKGFSSEVNRRFFEYRWPGNVRELRNVVENMVVLDLDGALDVDDLPPDLAARSPGSAADPPAAGPPSLIGRSMADIERWAIEQTLGLTGGNREEAARILAIGARTLYRKLDKYREDDRGGDASDGEPASPLANE